MAETAPAAAPPAAKAPKPKKKSAPKKKDGGPSLQKQIKDAIAESKERKGVSVASVKKTLAGKGVDVVKLNKRINTTLKRMVAAGVVSQTKGTGASGSFKLAKKEAKPKIVKKKAPAKAKKPVAKKATTPKKKAAAKKPVAKKPKSPAKKAAKKAPKKATPKKAAKKPVAKKVAPKKVKAVKKSPKKAAKAAPKKAKK